MIRAMLSKCLALTGLDYRNRCLNSESVIDKLATSKRFFLLRSELYFMVLKLNIARKNHCSMFLANMLSKDKMKLNI